MCERQRYRLKQHWFLFTETKPIGSFQGTGSGCGSMVECGLPKPETRVRFPSPAPLIFKDLRLSTYLAAGNTQMR